MEFAADVVDFGTAPEIYVSGLKSICRISAGVARVTYFTEHEGADGAIERRVCLHVMWDAEAYLACAPLFAAGSNAIRATAVKRRPVGGAH